MNGEGKLRMELVRTGIPSYGWYIFDGQVSLARLFENPCQT
jgi:hypothetical protein